MIRPFGMCSKSSKLPDVRHLVFCFAALSFLLLHFSEDVVAQRKTRAAKAKANQSRTVSELARLREEFVKATNDYKVNLEKLRASYEKNVRRAEDSLKQSHELFAQGLISRNDLEAAERAVAAANDKVTEVDLRTATADTQIAQTLLEAEAETKLAKTRIPKGGMVRTAALIRYNGGTTWALGDAWKVQRFFLEAFKKPLPITVFGQGSIHDRWRLDHRNAMTFLCIPMVRKARRY
jgi:hypothetical protein